MWHEFKIELPEELKEPVTAVLFEHGCQGVSEDAGRMDAYFGEDVKPSDIVEALSSFEGVSFMHAVVEEQDWYATWKEGFSPLHVAGLLICPPWLDEKPEAGEKLVVLDPGQAFGTGDHITTMTVLEMLKDWTESQPGLDGKRLLDLGTGTGILSIAGYLFGMRDITAVDNEPRAVETALTNLYLNGLTDKVRLLSGSIDAVGTGYDIILANIFMEALIEVMPLTARALNPGGTLILSGLIIGQEDRVIAAAESEGITLLKKFPGKGWVSALLKAD